MEVARVGDFDISRLIGIVGAVLNVASLKRHDDACGCVGWCKCERMGSLFV